MGTAISCTALVTPTETLCATYLFLAYLVFCKVLFVIWALGIIIAVVVFLGKAEHLFLFVLTN
jgi:hypothetical protein